MLRIPTQRLLLRPWHPSDREAFAQINADPQVMEFFPALLSREESDALFDRIQQHFQQHGFGLWAVELPTVAQFIGFVGLAVPQFNAHFTPCVEIGWRLASEYWGKGYATEGALAALRIGFEDLKLNEIVSFTSGHNIRSQQVMKRIGMKRSEADDFFHPLLPRDNWLAHHVLYRKTAMTNDSAV